MARDYCFQFIRIPAREVKPRSRELTYVADLFFHLFDVRNLEDLLDSAGEYVDLVKFAAFTTLFQPREFVKNKINLLRKYDIDVFLGGLFFELTLVQGKS
jgi:phosphosulfolactate synthase